MAKSRSLHVATPLLIPQDGVYPEPQEGAPCVFEQPAKNEFFSKLFDCIKVKSWVTVFALRGVAPDIPVGTIFRGCMPFMFVMTAYMVALIFIPWVSVALPNLVFPFR